MFNQRNKTKLLSVLLMGVLIFICISSTQVLAESQEATDKRYFEFDRDTGMIMNYRSHGGRNAVIPCRINEVAVREIGEWAFENDGLISVKIPEGVEVIGHGAFAGNELTSIELPNGLQVIRDRAFEANNLNSVVISDSVKVIKDRAFAKNELTSIDLPNGLEYLSGFNSNALTSVKIPEGVEVIGHGAFAGNELTSIEIGQGVEVDSDSIEGNFKKTYEKHDRAAGEYAREYPDGGWYQREERGTEVTDEEEITDPGYFEFNSSTGTITGYNTYGGFSVVIPSQINGVEVKEIEEEVFGDSDYFSVKLPDGVRVIGEAAFKENDLTSIEIPEEVEEIKDRAFAGNYLSSIEIPKGVEYLSGFNSNALTSLKIPESVREIGEWAFLGNDLTSIEIPEGVKKVGEWAFLGNNLTSVKIGGDVEIGNDSFEGNFKQVYEENDRSAGLYVRNDVDSDWYKEK